MENEHKTKNSLKNIFQTPKAKNKNINLRKTKSSSNMMSKNIDPFSSIKPFSEKGQKNKISNYKKNKNDESNHKIIINKIKQIKDKFSPKITKENRVKTENNFVNNEKSNNKLFLNSRNKLNKSKLGSKSLNIIPLPLRKNSNSPKVSKENIEKKNLNSMKLINNNIVYGKENKKVLKEKEIINKNILKPKKDIDFIPINRNNTRNNLNSARQQTRTKRIEFLYLPHIILDPLDVLNNQIEIILQKYEDKIKKFIETNKSKSVENMIQSAKKDYANKLFLLYQEKGKEIIKINNSYNKGVYNMIYNDEKITEDELNNNKEIQLKEIQKQFSEKKEILKIEFKNTINEINNSYNTLEQMKLNKKLITEMKNKFLKIFNDKNMINKKGINFSLKDYTNIIKNKNINVGKLRNSSFTKK